MRFVYHHRTAGRGGEGVHISSVVLALTAAGHRVEVVSPPGVDPLRSTDAVPLDKGAVLLSGMARLWKWISCSCPQFVFELLELTYNAYAAVRLLLAFRRDEPTVYYERYAFFLFAGVWLAKLCDKPVILEVNEVAGVQRARAQTFVPLARWLERKTFSRADEIVTVSSFLRREVLQRGGREGHVHVVPNAIDPARFRHGGGKAVRERLDLNGASVVGFVGWFDRWDRLDRLIDVVRDLRQVYPAARLLLVGDGPVASELSAKIRREGLDRLVVLSGPVARSDVPDYIDAMDICVLPDSNAYGSPIVLFEFMVMSKPVIAPDIEPIRDVLVEGETGWIVDRQDAVAFRATVQRLLDDPALGRQVGEAARRRVLGRHTWSAVACFVEQLAVRQVERRAVEGLGIGAL